MVDGDYGSDGEDIKLLPLITGNGKEYEAAVVVAANGCWTDREDEANFSCCQR